MHQRIATSLLLGLGFCAAAQSAPSVTSITGTVADDQVITINGTAFGSNPMRIEWLGGTSGTIERATNGSPFLATPRAGWYEDRDNDESFIDQRRAWSGRQSLVFDPLLARWHDQRFGLIYDTGTNFQELYSSYMVYLDSGGAQDGQWKMIRWCYTNSVTDDAVPNVYMSNWAGNPGDFLQNNGGGDAQKNNWFTQQILPLTGSWYRVETFIRPSSSPSSSDGSFWARITRYPDGQVQTQQFSNVKFYQTGETNRYRYIVFQNYMGNGSYSGAPGPTKLWMDDVYVSQSQARVEVCQAATWAACTKKEIQPPLTWSSNQITVRVNKGGLSSLTGTYLYVVDSTGAANANGIPLAGGKVPAPPTSVSVQ